jgi:hypothetical protein
MQQGQAEGEDRMSASGEDRISTFERHCALLLRTYPAAYRGERGEEIIGTLLETTPDGRAWPLPRDIRSLVIGGLQARAALNRRNSTVANLRIAVLVGVAAYLALAVAQDLGAFLLKAEYDRIELRVGSPVPFGWPTLMAVVLIAATVVLAWVSSRRGIVLAGAAAGAFVLAWYWPSGGAGVAVTELACLAVLIALAGRERPDRRWLWLIGPIALAGLLMYTDADAFGFVALLLLLALVVVSIAWLPIDARPAIAMVVFLLGIWLSAAMNNLALGSAGFLTELPFAAICTAVAVPAVWRLRRQSAHPGRPDRI